MHLQVVTRNAGVGTCASCSQHKPRVQIILEAAGSEAYKGTSRGVAVCMDCVRKPGISFECDLESNRPHAKVAHLRVARKSQESESRAASDIGGRRTLASGATNQDGDAVSAHFMVEQKMSGAKSLIVSEKTILKAAAQAARQGRDWVLRLKLTTLDMDLAVMKWPSAATLIKTWEEE